MPGHRKRRQFKQTDAFTRGMVIGLKRAGWNVGATRVTSARVDRRILRQAVAAPQATCTAILQHVQDTLDHSISTRTISRRLVANGLHSCRPLRRLPLTPPNRRQRLEWCRARSTWWTEWHRVVFSDESRFCLSSDSHRVRVWRRRGERSNPAAIVERPTVRQRGIMVWGAIAFDSRSPLLRIQGTMTAQRYVNDVLRPVTLPYLQGVPNALYQQDNARPHTARISQQALQDVQMLPWPPYSPDLSPIEHVWDIIGRRLHALPQPRSEDELWQMVERERRAIPQDAIRTLIDSLPRRVAACIAVRAKHSTTPLVRLSKEGNSYSVIVKKLKAEGLDVGKATICRVVNGIGKKREAESNEQKFQVDRPRPVRTPATVSKVKRLATTENPPSQRQLSRMCGTSLKTINNIIHKDLELDTRRKGKVHKLTPFHMKNRATNARKLYEEHLAGSRSEYTATLDEAWMYVTYCNGIRKICYIKRGNQVPDNWVHQCSETFPKGFMVVGVMTGRGVLPLIKVPSKVKVNSEFYIECVLKPVIEQLKDLYPGEMDKVFLHHDKASSHTSNKTQQFLQEMKDTLGLNFIRNSDIPVKSPDASPLDFYGFGMLKQRLFNRRPKTEAGLWKAAQEEWSNVSLSKVKEVFAAWKVRCREIAKKKGKHIEHMKKIHVRKIKF
ncbi:IKK1 [Cordylochernes scorpioides]|uniref:IKK1 n=1 Tax=Cordylochernes scorpioides TaxID=51811 RepID=A0ABY6L106_9ARAC|nr:IKK1 [Cordylochernes scorpioides]